MEHSQTEKTGRKSVDKRVSAWYNNKAVGREDTPKDRVISILKIEQCTKQYPWRFFEILILLNYLRSQAEDKKICKLSILF